MITETQLTVVGALAIIGDIEAKECTWPIESSGGRNADAQQIVARDALKRPL